MVHEKSIDINGSKSNYLNDNPLNNVLAPWYAIMYISYLAEPYQLCLTEWGIRLRTHHINVKHLILTQARNIYLPKNENEKK